MAPKDRSKKKRTAPPSPPRFDPTVPISIFVDDIHEAYFNKLSLQSVTESKWLDQSKLRYPVTELFQTSSLLPLLGLRFSYNKKFLRILLANMEVAADRSLLRSRVERQDVLITREDLHIYLGVSKSGPNPFVECTVDGFDWLSVNNVLRDNVACGVHLPETKTLADRAYIVQSVLKHSVVPKAGDRGSISPGISLATFYILTQQDFDVADMMMHYIERMISVRRASAGVSRNVALGSALAFLLKGKFGIVSSEPADAEPTPFTNGNFSSVRSSFSMSPGKAPMQPAPETAPAPASTSRAAGTSSFGDEDLDRFFADTSELPHTPAPPSSESFDFTALSATLSRLETNQGVFLSTLEGYQTSNTVRFDSIQDSIEDLRETQDAMRTRVDWMYEHWWTPPPPPPADE